MSEVTRHEPDVSVAAKALARRALAESDVSPGALMVPMLSAVRAAIWAFAAGMRVAGNIALRERHCRVCGCTALRTCAPDDPCHWVARDLCSACEPYLETAL